MHAYLITGSTHEERTKRARETIADNGINDVLYIPSADKHTISVVRDLTKTLSIASFSGQGRGVLLEDVDKLTTEAANAFLKTLEEPTSDVVFALTSPNKDLVLETISSRALNIDLGSKKQLDYAAVNIQDFAKASLSEKFTILDKIADRKESISLCQQHLIWAHKLLLLSSSDGEKSRKLTDLLLILDQSVQDLEANVNTKLVLGHLFLHYPVLSSAEARNYKL